MEPYWLLCQYTSPAKAYVNMLPWWQSTRVHKLHAFCGADGKSNETRASLDYCVRLTTRNIEKWSCLACMCMWPWWLIFSCKWVEGHDIVTEIALFFFFNWQKCCESISRHIFRMHSLNEIQHWKISQLEVYQFACHPTGPYWTSLELLYMYPVILVKSQ